MLVPGSFASGEAVGLAAIVEHQRAGQALPSLIRLCPESFGAHH